MSACLTLAPFRECGWGNCFNGSCICIAGFTQNYEFFWEEFDTSIITYCDFNSGVDVFVNGLLIFFITGLIILQALLLEVSKKNQVRFSA